MNTKKEDDSISIDDIERDLLILVVEIMKIKETHNELTQLNKNNQIISINELISDLIYKVYDYGSVEYKKGLNGRE